MDRPANSFCANWYTLSYSHNLVMLSSNDCLVKNIRSWIEANEKMWFIVNGQIIKTVFWGCFSFASKIFEKVLTFILKDHYLNSITGLRMHSCQKLSICATTERINVRGYSNIAWNVIISHFISQYTLQDNLFTLRWKPYCIIDQRRGVGEVG